VMAELVIGAVLTLMGNMLADVGYALVDPRIRTG
jgi:peptide/nickel transport system permease protein